MARSPIARFLCHLPLQFPSIPLRQVRARIVRALAELQQSSSWIRRLPYIVVLQQELAQFFVIEGKIRPHFCVGESLRRGRGVGVKRRILEDRAPRRLSSRPPSGADDFVRVRFLRDRVRTVAFRRAAPRESRYRQAETPPAAV